MWDKARVVTGHTMKQQAKTPVRHRDSFISGSFDLESWTLIEHLTRDSSLGQYTLLVFYFLPARIKRYIEQFAMCVECHRSSS